MRPSTRSFVGAGLAAVLVLGVLGCQAGGPTAVEAPRSGGGQEITGMAPGYPATPFQMGDLAPASHIPGAIVSIEIGSTPLVQNCIPFGTNGTYGFTGFIYRNVPAFDMQAGDVIAFDLGNTNDVETRRDIFFAVANKNPASCTLSGIDVVSQGVAAQGGWTQVVSETQVPQNPFGNTVVNDFELRYTAEAPFHFPGGGLLVGFRGHPPAAYTDGGCQQVLVGTSCLDASGNFYARFFYKSDRDTGVLDVLTSGSGNASSIGQMVILHEGGGGGAATTCPEATGILRTALDESAIPLPPFVHQVLNLILHRLEGGGQPLGSGILTVAKLFHQFGILDEAQFTDIQNAVDLCVGDVPPLFDSRAGTP